MIGALPHMDAEMTVRDYTPGQPIPILIRDPRSGHVQVNELKRWVKPYTLVTEPDEITLAPVPAVGPLRASARPSPTETAAQGKALLALPGRGGHLLLRDPRAHHFSPGEILGRFALRDVRAGLEGQPGNLRVLHHRPRGRLRAAGGNPDSARARRQLLPFVPAGAGEPAAARQAHRAPRALPRAAGARRPGASGTRQAELHPAPGRVLRLGGGDFPRRLGNPPAWDLPLLPEGSAAAPRAVRHPAQYSSRQTRSAHFPPADLLGLLGETAGPLCHARPGRGHLGAQRRRTHRGGF